jgi:hypothetical protein
MRPRRAFSVDISLLALLAGTLLAEPASAQPPAIDEGAQFIVFTGTNRDLSLGTSIAEGMRSAGFQDVRIESDASTQWLVGLHAGVHIGRFVLGFTEVLFNNTGRSSVSGRAGPSIFSPRATIEARTRLVELTGGLHVQLPVGTWRVRPYVGGGAGLMRGVIDFTLPSETIRQTTNDVQYHIDAGVRIFATRHVGVSTEFRSVQVPDLSFYRVLIGAVFKVN